MITFETLMETARATNRERDEIDRQVGVATPLQAGPRAVVRTAVTALEAGLNTRSISPVAEAVAMLEEMLKHLCVKGRAQGEWSTSK